MERSAPCPANIARLTAEVKRSVLPLAEGRRFSNPMKKVNELLLAMGYEVGMPWYQPGGLDDIFQTYAHPEVMEEAFATLSDVCGTHAKCRRNLNRVAVIVLAVSQSAGWRSCLAPGHDPHALARNVLACLKGVNGWGTAQNAIYTSAASWLCVIPADPKGAMSNFAPTWKWQYERQRLLASAMFGDHWWMFNTPEEGDLLDADIVLAQRPSFMPGILDRPMAGPSMQLPEMRL